MAHPSSTTASNPLTTTMNTQIILATKIFIDEVPDYTLLARCAEQRVSSIVRDMNYGCGDGSRMTSYACFCYSSSAYFNRMIGTQVQTACGASNNEQGTDAVQVFSNYCQMGQTRGIPAPITVSASTTYAAAATAAVTIRSSSSVAMSEQPSNSVLQPPTIPSPTAVSITINNGSSKSSSHATTVVVAVLVPLLIVSLLVAGALFWRARRKEAQNRTAEDKKSYTEETNLVTQYSHSDAAELPVKEKSPYFVHELPAAKTRQSPVELAVVSQRFGIAELPGHDISDQKR